MSILIENKTLYNITNNEVIYVKIEVEESDKFSDGVIAYRKFEIFILDLSLIQLLLPLKM